MNYANITKDDMNNGDGFRVTLWVQGCSHHCEKCHNPETWNPQNGKPFTEEQIEKIFEELRKPHIKGLTLSGGDPLYVDNRETVTELCKLVKENFPKKDIWCWTGYNYDEVKNLEIMNYIDVLIDGEFVYELKDAFLKWRGSSNQRVIDIKKTRKENKVVLYCD